MALIDNFIKAIKNFNHVKVKDLMDQHKDEHASLLKNTEEQLGMGILQQVISQEQQIFEKAQTDGESEEVQSQRRNNVETLHVLMHSEAVRNVLSNKPDEKGQLPIAAAIQSDMLREDTPYLDIIFDEKFKNSVDAKMRNGTNQSTILHSICGIEKDPRDGTSLVTQEQVDKVLNKLKQEIILTSDKKSAQGNADLRLLHEMAKIDNQGNSSFHTAAANTAPCAMSYVCSLTTQDNKHQEEVITRLKHNLFNSRNSQGLSPVTMAISVGNNEHIQPIFAIEELKNHIANNDKVKNDIVDACVLYGNGEALKDLAQVTNSTSQELVQGYKNRHFENGTMPDKAKLKQLVQNNNFTNSEPLFLLCHAAQNDIFNKECAESAAQIGNLEVFQGLIDNNLVDLDDSLKEVAVEGNQKDILDYIRTKSLGHLEVNNATSAENEFHIAAQSSHPNNNIVSTVRDINRLIAKNADGRTPVELAIEHNNLDFADAIISKYQRNMGESPDLVDLALKQTAISGNVDALKMMIDKHGADIYQTFGHEDETLIEVAARGDNPQKMVQYIMTEHKKHFVTRDDEMQQVIHKAILQILPNQPEQDWHQDLLDNSDLRAQDLKSLAMDKGINPISRSVISGNELLCGWLNEKFPELKNQALENGKTFYDKMSASMLSHNTGKISTMITLGLKPSLKEGFLAKTTKKLPVIEQDNTNIKQQSSANRKNDIYRDGLYKDHGPLEKYAKLIRSGESLKGDLSGVEDGKDSLLKEKSPTGHTLPTLVAAYGTVSQWQELTKAWNKVNEENRSTKEMCNDNTSSLGTPLEIAIKSGNEYVVNSMVKNINKVDALRISIEQGNVESARKMLDSSSSISDKQKMILSETDKSGNNLLHIAVDKGDSVMVGELIAQITELTPKNETEIENLAELLRKSNKDGKTIAHKAVLLQNSQDSQVILDMLRGLQSLVNDLGNTKLHLERAQDSSKKTALDYAIEEVNLHAVEGLIGDLQSNSDQNDKQVQLFKDAIVNPNCSVGIAQALLPDRNVMSRDEIRNSLVQVIETGNSEVLQYLLEAQGIAEQFLDNNWEQWLSHACKAGNIGNIDFLMSQGVNMHTSNAEQESPFDSALKNPKLTDWCTKYLRQNYAKVPNALHVAAQLGDMESIDTIMANNADVYSIQNDLLPIEVAAKHGAGKDVLLRLIDEMSTKEPPEELEASKIQSIYQIVAKHADLQNSEQYSDFIIKLASADKINNREVGGSMLSQAIESEHVQMVDHLLNTCDIANLDVTEQNTFLKQAIDSGNPEVTAIVLGHTQDKQKIISQDMLTKIALSGNEKLFDLLSGPKGVNLAYDNIDIKRDWAHTFAKSGMLNKLEARFANLDAGDESKLLSDKQGRSLLQSMAEGGLATTEMLDWYKKHFPEAYEQEIQAPINKTTLQRLTGNRVRPIWEMAASSGNVDLADALRNDLNQVVKEKENQGAVDKQQLSSASDLNQQIVNNYQEWGEGKNNAQYDQIKNSVAEIENARNIKTRFNYGKEILHEKSEGIINKQNALARAIQQEDTIDAITICTTTPNILDTHNHTIGDNLANYLLAHGSTKMINSVAPYANQSIVDSEGNTILHKLLQKSDVNQSTLTTMLSKGASLIALNSKGESAHSLIASNDNYSIELKEWVKAQAQQENHKADKVNHAYVEFESDPGRPQKLLSALKEYDTSQALFSSKVALRCLDDAVIKEDRTFNNHLDNFQNFIKKGDEEALDLFKSTDRHGNNILHVLCKKAVESEEPYLSCDALGRMIKVMGRNNLNADLLAAKNLDNESPLEILSRNSHSIGALKACEDLVTPKEMVKAVDMNGLFRQASKYGNVSLCEHLLHSGKYRNIGINSVDKNGDSSLVKAVHNSHYEMVKFLLKEGANIDQLDGNNNTVLQLLLDKLHSGEDVEGRLEETVKTMQLLLVSGVDLTQNKNKSDYTAIDMICGIERSASLMNNELLKLQARELTSLSASEHKKLEFLKENQHYANAMSSIAGLTLESNSNLVKDEETLNNQLSSAVVKRSRIKERGKLGVIPIPFSKAAKEIGEAAISPLYRDNDFTGRIKGGVIDLKIHNPNSKVRVSELFTSEIIKSREVTSFRLDDEKYQATVQKSANGKRNYTVEEGEIKLAVKGINNKPPKINVRINADGTIRADGDWKHMDLSGSRNVYVGGIKLTDALASGRWKREKSSVVNPPTVPNQQLSPSIDHSPDLDDRGHHLSSTPLPEHDTFNLSSDFTDTVPENSLQTTPQHGTDNSPQSTFPNMENISTTDIGINENLRNAAQDVAKSLSDLVDGATLSSKNAVSDPPPQGIDQLDGPVSQPKQDRGANDSMTGVEGWIEELEGKGKSALVKHLQDKQESEQVSSNPLQGIDQLDELIHQLKKGVDNPGNIHKTQQQDENPIYNAARNVGESLSDALLGLNQQMQDVNNKAQQEDNQTTKNHMRDDSNTNEGVSSLKEDTLIQEGAVEENAVKSLKTKSEDKVNADAQKNLLSQLKEGSPIKKRMEILLSEQGGDFSVQQSQHVVNNQANPPEKKEEDIRQSLNDFSQSSNQKVSADGKKVQTNILGQEKSTKTTIGNLSRSDYVNMHKSPTHKGKDKVSETKVNVMSRSNSIESGYESDHGYESSPDTKQSTNTTTSEFKKQAKQLRETGMKEKKVSSLEQSSKKTPDPISNTDTNRRTLVK